MFSISLAFRDDKAFPVRGSISDAHSTIEVYFNRIQDQRLSVALNSFFFF